MDNSSSLHNDLFIWAMVVYKHKGHYGTTRKCRCGNGKMPPSLHFLCNAKFRTARSRVVFYLFIRGRYRFSIYLFQRCLAFHFIDLFVRWIDQIPPCSRKKSLTMRSSSEWKEITASLPAGPEGGHRLWKDFFDGGQFLIHRDPQRLEGPRRRVDAVAAAGRDDSMTETSSRVV
jgi:hypothetical protein